ncbi:MULTISPECIES: class I SAM-dependent methyltransferase [Pontibacter]|uniref:Methyltransferase domain-containing protein n=1 Tax=Pontibacter lucknowensis TaxID=1077936 RepID=A0A1N6UWV1_9BACT|nr:MULTISPECIES: class I SAM-dependent methyltransferase [Pontibacter]EJF11590.1 SAM-dependent methyltransferase [Pontibacter sp. BAB1700]SIQ70085.1 Methyltransferase domain-containing protein [Pontibacter lucknowensis]
MKDNFSGHAVDYARYRPTYPPELIAQLASMAPAQQLAWDCATGNGQVAGMLASFFDQVVATDISENQLKNAVQLPNISYRVEQAEESSLPDHAVDLVVVAQAVHWFDFDRFYQEVKRVLKPDGLIAVIGYGLLSTHPSLDKVIRYFYSEVLDGYWDPERSYLDEDYRTIPFPFQEVQLPQFSSSYTWTPEDLIGYLNTWSAVKHYEKQQGHNPVQLVEKQLCAAFEAPTATITFNILTRVGKANNS